MPVNPLLFNNNLTPSKTTPSINLEDPKPILEPSLVGSNTVGKKPTLEQEIEKTVSDLIKKGAFKTNGSKYNSGESEISNVLLQPYKGDTVNTDLLTNPDYEAAKRVTESFSDRALKTTKAFGANASGTLLTGLATLPNLIGSLVNVAGYGVDLLKGKPLTETSEYLQLGGDSQLDKSIYDWSTDVTERNRLYKSNWSNEHWIQDMIPFRGDGGFQEIVSQLGFGVGMIAEAYLTAGVGGLVSKTLKIGSGASKLASNISKSLNRVDKLDEGLNAIVNYSKSRSLQLADNALQLTAEAIEYSPKLYRAYVGAHSEAVFEGFEGQERAKQDLVEKFYAKNGRMPIGVELDKINSVAENIRKERYNLNLALLIVPNYIQLGGIMKPLNVFKNQIGEKLGLSSFSMFGESKLGKLVFDKTTKEFVVKNADKYVLESANPFFKTGFGKAVKKGIELSSNTLQRFPKVPLALSEGFEEFGQLVIDNYTKNLYMGKNYNSKADLLYDSVQDSLTQEGAKSFLAGVFSGSLQQSVIKGIELLSKTDDELQREIQNNQKLADTLNTYAKKTNNEPTPALLREYLGSILETNSLKGTGIEQFENAQREVNSSTLREYAAELEDDFSYLNLKQQSTFDFLHAIARQDRKDILEQYLDDIKGSTSEQLKSVYNVGDDFNKDEFTSELLRKYEDIRKITKRVNLQFANRELEDTFQNIDKADPRDRNAIMQDYMNYANYKSELVHKLYQINRLRERKDSIIQDLGASYNLFKQTISPSKFQGFVEDNLKQLDNEIALNEKILQVANTEEVKNFTQEELKNLHQTEAQLLQQYEKRNALVKNKHLLDSTPEQISDYVDFVRKVHHVVSKTDLDNYEVAKGIKSAYDLGRLDKYISDTQKIYDELSKEKGLENLQLEKLKYANEELKSNADYIDNIKHYEGLAEVLGVPVDMDVIKTTIGENEFNTYENLLKKFNEDDSEVNLKALNDFVSKYKKVEEVKPEEKKPFKFQPEQAEEVIDKPGDDNYIEEEFELEPSEIIKESLQKQQETTTLESEKIIPQIDAKTDIEAKKADIERRRQEDLKKGQLFLMNDGTYGGSRLVSLEEYSAVQIQENNLDSDVTKWDYNTFNDTGIFVNLSLGVAYIVPNNSYNGKKAEVVKVFINKTTKRFDLSNPRIINTPNIELVAKAANIDSKELYNEVLNAITKYDAELKAVEQPTTSNQSEIENFFDNNKSGTYQTPEGISKFENYSSKGWKIHVLINKGQEKQVAIDLAKMGLYYKLSFNTIGTWFNSFNTSGATIYIGSKENAIKVIKELQSKNYLGIDNTLLIKPIIGSQRTKTIYGGSNSDISISDNIAIRFDIAKTNHGWVGDENGKTDKKYSGYGFPSYLGKELAGIPYLRSLEKEVDKSTRILENKDSSQEDKREAINAIQKVYNSSLIELEKDFGKDFLGIAEIKALEEIITTEEATFEILPNDKFDFESLTALEKIDYALKNDDANLNNTFPSNTNLFTTLKGFSKILKNVDIQDFTTYKDFKNFYNKSDELTKELILKLIKPKLSFNQELAGKLIFSTSGSGKTTLAKDYKNLFDADNLLSFVLDGKFNKKEAGRVLAENQEYKDTLVNLINFLKQNNNTVLHSNAALISNTDIFIKPTLENKIFDDFYSPIINRIPDYKFILNDKLNPELFTKSIEISINKNEEPVKIIPIAHFFEDYSFSYYEPKDGDKKRNLITGKNNNQEYQEKLKQRDRILQEISINPDKRNNLEFRLVENKGSKSTDFQIGEHLVRKQERIIELIYKEGDQEYNLGVFKLLDNFRFTESGLNFNQFINEKLREGLSEDEAVTQLYNELVSKNYSLISLEYLKEFYNNSKLMESIIQKDGKLPFDYTVNQNLNTGNINLGFSNDSYLFTLQSRKQVKVYIKFPRFEEVGSKEDMIRSSTVYTNVNLLTSEISEIKQFLLDNLKEVDNFISGGFSLLATTESDKRKVFINSIEFKKYSEADFKNLINSYVNILNTDSLEEGKRLFDKNMYIRLIPNDLSQQLLLDYNNSNKSFYLKYTIQNEVINIPLSLGSEVLTYKKFKAVLLNEIKTKLKDKISKNDKIAETDKNRILLAINELTNVEDILYFNRKDGEPSTFQEIEATKDLSKINKLEKNNIKIVKLQDSLKQQEIQEPVVSKPVITPKIEKNLERILPDKIEEFKEKIPTKVRARFFKTYDTLLANGDLQNDSSFEDVKFSDFIKPTC